jgi:hypothetical protein
MVLKQTARGKGQVWNFPKRNKFVSYIKKQLCRFISDFILTHKEFGEIRVNNLITLLFVKIKGEWKIVHEHHSPANI